MSEPQDQSQLYQQIIAKCWNDADFKAKLLSDPRAVLAAEGFTVPESINVKVVDGGDSEVIFYIPARIPDLTDADLQQVVTGWDVGEVLKFGLMKFYSRGLAYTPDPSIEGWIKKGWR